jgi:hypothetical protein
MLPSSPSLFTLDRRRPPVSFDDLALMLEIDLTVINDRSRFRRRLRRALDDAYAQGTTQKASLPRSIAARIKLVASK